jgi:hypothetical protein
MRGRDRTMNEHKWVKMKQSNLAWKNACLVSARSRIRLQHGALSEMAKIRPRNAWLNPIQSSSLRFRDDKTQGVTVPSIKFFFLLPFSYLNRVGFSCQSLPGSQVLIHTIFPPFLPYQTTPITKTDKQTNKLLCLIYFMFDFDFSGRKWCRGRSTGN